VLYIVASIGVASVIAPNALSTAPAPFADAARVLFGPGAGALMALGAAVACFGALNGWILIAGQVPMAIARDGLFPRMFARMSTRDTPAVGLVISSALTTALIVMNSSRGLVDLFTFVILLGTLNALVPYAFCSLAGLMTEHRRRHVSSPVSRGATAIACLAFAYSFWAISGAGAEVVYWGFLLLLLGVPAYVWMVRHSSIRPSIGPDGR
jgi:APA family basic amino acid/polyamine antiporter